MKAGVVHASQDIRYEEIETPKPKKGEVLIKVKYTGICGSDVPRVNGDACHFFPNVLGHEFSGTVVETGEEVTRLKKGDRVAGVPEGWKDVIAVVVQPGVEFGDDQVFYYNREAAGKLCADLKDYPEVVFEGHSTDYQSAQCLREMVEDGIAILKVGPALTYGMREALFALSMMEKELVPPDEQAYLIETLEHVMTDNPNNWQKHYHGNIKQLGLARKYSFSDRARYYMGDAKMEAAVSKLFANLRNYEIPMNMLHQYMPKQYEAVRQGTLKNDPKELVMDGVVQFMYDYEYAARQKKVS